MFIYLTKSFKQVLRHFIEHTALHNAFKMIKQLQ